METRVNEAQLTDTTLVHKHEQQALKVNHKRKGKENAKHKITRQYVIKEETKVLGIKPLCCPLSGNRSTRQSVGIHGLASDLPSLIDLMYLSPPSSYSNMASQNRALSSSPDPAIHPIASTKPHWFLLAIP